MALIYCFVVLNSMIKAFLYKILFGRRFYIALTSLLFPGVSIEIRDKATVKINKNVRIRNNSHIASLCGGKVNIGENTGINRNCVVVAHESIDIGSDVEIGPNVMIYDHDHLFKAGNKTKEMGFSSKPIVIGDNVWIGANVVVLKGVHIGAGSVVAAGTVVKEDVPDNTVVYNERIIKYKEV